MNRLVHPTGFRSISFVGFGAILLAFFEELIQLVAQEAVVEVKFDSTMRCGTLLALSQTLLTFEVLPQLKHPFSILLNTFMEV